MTYEPSVVTGMLPCPAVILTVAAGERHDAMTATAVFVSENPPLLSVSVAEHLLTRELIDEAGEFVVNLATPEQVEMVRKLGSTHGGEIDKLTEFDVATQASENPRDSRRRDTKCKRIISASTGTPKSSSVTVGDELGS